MADELGAVFNKSSRRFELKNIKKVDEVATGGDDE
jgi:hypothetical protein